MDRSKQTCSTNTLWRQILGLLFMVMLIHTTSVFASENTGSITGKVVTPNGEPLAGVNVFLEGTNKGTVTNSAGKFKLMGIPAGEYEVIAQYIGKEKGRKTVSVQENATVLAEFQLDEIPLIMPGIVVTAARTDETLESLNSLSPTTVKRSSVRVTGELIRELPGVDAVRRGPVGLDPVVRGLRETEVGAYIDGTRTFPGGPARMDSPLSHIDPSAIKSIEVIKGPYALTWGAGNLSALRVETFDPSTNVSDGTHGNLSSGYDSNLDAFEGATSFFGRQSNVSYWFHSAWREGDDYEAGNGETVQGDFLSREIRGKLGFNLAPNSVLNISLGYQSQEDLDYPGRLLDARFFDTRNLSASWRVNQDNGLVRSFEVLGYFTDVDHGMDNDDKPNKGIVKVNLDTGSRVIGGRLAADLAPNDTWQIEAGGDFYNANRDAERSVLLITPDILLIDLVWPDATITDIGAFTRVSRPLGGIFRATGTVRLDFVNADADTASDFFRNNVSSDLDATETNFSGAATLNAVLNNHWLVTIGAGSAVRTADATERYSDRFPSSKAQTSAEFIGDPSLEPERSTQADLWIEGTYSRFSVYVNAFVRQIDDYITIQADPTLTTRLPLSPPTVFRYINGKAKFWGFEASTAYNLTSNFSFDLGVKYLWGEDEELDEPALGIAPFGVDGGLRYRSSDGLFYVEGLTHILTEQDRVAAARGEIRTGGYTTFDIRGGIEIIRGGELRVGVTNLTDKNYTNHLNSKNPFTRQPIPEPGRVFYTDLSYSF